MLEILQIDTRNNNSSCEAHQNGVLEKYSDQFPYAFLTK